ncbi:MAG TPA: S24 family peptidase [Oscillospiraceae bacterium]|nr:S24 family peptidase [Oscillospiraceae bacterium]
MFGEQLKRLRGQAGLSQNDLGKKLFVSAQAVGKWERDEATPNPETISKIAMIFGVSADVLLDNKAPKSTSAAPIFNPNDKIGQEMAHLRAALNDDGLDQWLNYGQYLTGKPELQRKDGDNILDLPKIRKYLTGPAAGKASPIQGEDYEDIPYPEDAPRGADFCVDVRGNSMEPYIKDGSTVYVRRGVSLQQFDVGVFFYSGDVYVKQICADYSGGVNLLSANPRREDANIRIEPSDASYLVCFGKVLLPHRLPEPNYHVDGSRR